MEDGRAGDTADESRVPAVTRAAAALHRIGLMGPSPLSSLAKELQIPKSSLLGILQSLTAERLLWQLPDGKYALGSAVAELAAAHRSMLPRVATLGVTIPNESNPFYTAELSSIVDTANSLGVSVLTRVADGLVSNQVAHLDEFLHTAVDAIIVDAVHSEGVARSIRQASRRGIPVVAVNVRANHATASVTTDNVQAGELAAKHLADLLGNRGNLAVIGGLPVTAVTDRVAGFMSFLRDHPHLSVVQRLSGDHSEAGGQDAAHDLADHIEGVFAINDPTAIGAVHHLAQLGRVTPVVSVDGSSAAVELIASHSNLVATVAQSPKELGRRAVLAAVDQREGRSLTLKDQLLSTVLVTAETLPNYTSWD